MVGVARSDLPSHLRASQRRTAQRTHGLPAVGRIKRHPQRRARASGSKIPAMVNISERPAEADDRAVPGHWEGDLIVGANNPRLRRHPRRASTRFGHADQNRQQNRRPCRRPSRRAHEPLPAQLARSLTWDQGSELAAHTASASPPGSPCTSATPTHPGNAAPTKTGTASSDNSSPKAPTSPLHPTRTRRHRRPPQRTPPQDPRMGYSRRTIQRTRRDHHLNPPGARDARRGESHTLDNP